MSDLGGAENTSEAERAIISLAATLKVELEQMDCKFAQAGGASERQLDLYGRQAGNVRRLLESVGLERRPRSVNGGDRLGELLGDG